MNQSQAQEIHSQSNVNHLLSALGPINFCDQITEYKSQRVKEKPCRYTKVLQERHGNHLTRDDVSQEHYNTKRRSHDLIKSIFNGLHKKTLLGHFFHNDVLLELHGLIYPLLATFQGDALHHIIAQMNEQ